MITDSAALRSLLPGLIALALPSFARTREGNYLRISPDTPDGVEDFDYLLAATARTLNPSESPQVHVSASAARRVSDAAANVLASREVVPTAAYVVADQERSTVTLVVVPLAIIEVHAKRGGAFSVGKTGGGYFINMDRIDDVAATPGVLAVSTFAHQDRLGVGAAGE